MPDQPTPQGLFLPDFHEQDGKFKKEQEKQCNRHHVLPKLPDDTPVWVATKHTSEPGTVKSPAGTPGSHIVETSNGQVRRNQQPLIPIPTE